MASAAKFQISDASREIVDNDSVVCQRSKIVIYFKLGIQIGRKKVTSFSIRRVEGYTIKNHARLIV